MLYSAIHSASPHTHTTQQKLPCDFNLLKRKASPQETHTSLINSHTLSLSLSLALFPYQLSALQHKCTHAKKNFNSLIDTCEKKTKARARTGIKYVSYQNDDDDDEHRTFFLAKCQKTNGKMTHHSRKKKETRNNTKQ